MKYSVVPEKIYYFIIKIINMRKFLFQFLLVLFTGLLLSSCTLDDDKDDNLNPLGKQARVQVAYDATDVAFKFTWKTQEKIYPVGFGNAGKNYPMQFHDFLTHNGTKFDRLASEARMMEDRVTFMIDKFDSDIPGYGLVGCAITCHSNMESHHLTVDGILDHWHWRGQRSGPMGYAEDAAINNVERIRDNLGTPPTKFLRSGGDRLRENQAALSGISHPVLSDGLPRFVFNKGKKLGNGHEVKNYFLTNVSNDFIIDPYVSAPAIQDLSVNRSLLVVYQDKTFDNEDKVNAIDLGYLVWIATAEVDHLPSHLRDTESADFAKWKNDWAIETGITASAAAKAKLDDVHQEWVSSGKKAMITRSVGFIYESDQHDITSERSYDPARKEWTVVLKRKLSTGSNRDADLSGLVNGTEYAFSFAMHDAGGAAITHDISMPLTLSNADGGDVKAISIANLENINWNDVPAYDTHWVKQSAMPHFYYDWLVSDQHPGAGSVGKISCATCHNENTASLFNLAVLK